MALDGITTQLLADELNNELSGARIDKVFQPDKYTLILHIRSNTMKKLLISFNPSGARINLTESTRENPQVPPSFCMLLRKYLSGSRIQEIINPGYERIVEIKVTTTDELHDVKEIRLIVELMGRYSNCILVNQSGKIIDSAIHVDYSVSRVREVMPARIYEYPPVQDKYKPEQAFEIVKNGKLPLLPTELNRPMDKALLNSILGLSPIIARQLCVRADIDDRLPAGKLEEKDKETLVSVLNDFLKNILTRKYKPAVYYTLEGNAGEYSPFILSGFASSESFDTLSECIDKYYEDKDRAIDLDNHKQKLKAVINSALSHAMHKSELHRLDVLEGSKADYLKKCGDLILSYTWAIEEKASSVTVSDYYQDPPVDIDIELNPSLSPADNAQDYYKRFRKSKRKGEMASRYLEEDKDAVDYLRSLKMAADAASCMEDITAVNEELKQLSGTDTLDNGPKKKQSKEGKVNPNLSVGKAKSGKASSRALRDAARKAKQQKQSKKGESKNTKPLSYRRYETADGYQILCGRNNIQNDELTFRVADKNDWWFHVKGLPGTHVILKTKAGEDMPSDNAVIEAAQAAAFFSKEIVLEEHMNAGNAIGQIKVEIDYCPVSHVKKLPKAKPGMVIYESYYSILVSPIEPHS